ncbi:DUF2497 domain-containing protein [Novosphingobium lentum]|uniref:DUF2497 domain-containing protein n=1 Tax=Novosphingobium lentum TaxID=145287 RepID=UPI0008334C42|nr:DUF2497 domain-containing protein [Novosphingobium lentum]
MRQMGEPSVEEILESIKKVIARDNRSEAAQLRTRREEGLITAHHATHEPRARTHEVLELTEAEAADDEAVYGQSGHASAGHEGDDDAAAEEAGLLPEAAAASMRDSLTALAMLAEPGASPQIVRSGETSLEGLARELMRPMLAEWLENNLPAMVEKMVAAEIARIAGKKG